MSEHDYELRAFWGLFAQWKCRQCDKRQKTRSHMDPPVDRSDCEPSPFDLAPA